MMANTAKIFEPFSFLSLMHNETMPITNAATSKKMPQKRPKMARAKAKRLRNFLVDKPPMPEPEPCGVINSQYKNSFLD